jgi:hypothetical protein
VTRHRILKAALIFVVGAALLIALAGPIVSRVLTTKVKARLEAENIHIRSLSVNLFTRSITLKDVEWQQKARINSVYARGIRVLPLIRNNIISIQRIDVDGGTLDLTFDSTKHNHPADSIDIKSVDIDRITISDIAVSIKRDTVTEYKGIVGLSLYHVALDSMQGFRDLSSYTFRNLETSVKDLRIHYPGALYVFKIKELAFNKELRALHVDSLMLDPLPSKEDWGKVVKNQETRTTVKIGVLDATGVTMGIHMNDTAVMATSLTLDGWYIHAYKNKKYPFRRTAKFPLPMESFRAIGIGVEVDSIKLHKGTIIYEELPTEGFHYSWIKFDDVEATMNSVNNRDSKHLSAYSTLEATGRVMKSGEVKATFTLPLEPRQRYSARGTITNVPLKELNPLLKDLAFVEISSGKLNKMLFQFDYDDERSQGQVHFDYEDLKILSLKKAPDMDVNAFKTMLVNTAVKNNKTLDGDINVKRFKRKAVFHLWTMSLLDGIKAAIIPGNGKKKDNDKKK